MSNTVWKFNNKFGMAYLESKDLVEGLLKLAGERMDTGGVVATYCSSGGRAFAWQVCFGIEQMDRVSRLLGLEPAAPRPGKKKSPARKGTKPSGGTRRPVKSSRAGARTVKKA